MPALAAALLGIISFWAFSPVAAHHGLMGFDTTTLVEIRGQVVDFELMDPHSLLYVDVRHNDKTTTHWVIEGGAANGIVSAGLSREILEAKPLVVVKAYPGRDTSCSPQCRASGREFSFEDQALP